MKNKRVPAVVDASELIRLELPNADQMAYMHAVLSQIGLPRSKVEGRRFERTSGGASLLVEAGEIWDGREWIPQPVPYGPKPRIMMADLFTTALRTGSRVLDLGDSVTEYLRHLGWTTQGGAEGPLTMFKNQVKALAVCRMTLGVAYGDRTHQISGQPIEGFESWLDTSGKQRTLWPATIQLSEQFWKSLQAHAVPLDIRAIHGLQGSALALDLYTWLAYRLHRLKKPQTLPWKNLREQFGQEYKEERDFKREILRLMPSVRLAYPQAKVTEVYGGLELHPSLPPVSPKLLPKASRRARSLELPSGKPAAHQKRASQPTPAASEQPKPQQADEIEVRTDRVYLHVPYAEKDWVKSYGARWDEKKRAWYVPPHLPLPPFTRWLQS